MGFFTDDISVTTNAFRQLIITGTTLFLSDADKHFFYYGLAGDKPAVGDWDTNGTTTIGIYRIGRFYLRNSNTNGFAEITFCLGIPGDMPIAGNWDGLP